MEKDRPTRTTRRIMLAGLGAAGIGTMASGSAVADESDSESNESKNQDDGDEPAGIGFPPAHLTEWGEPVAMGNGEAKTFVTLNSAEMPMFVGFHLTADALESLGDEHDHFSLQFPDAIDQTAFKWVGIDWGPEGHGPPGIYNIPHFDIHFYMISESEVNEIPAINFPPGQENGDPYTEPIPEDQFPPNYFRDHAVVPQMGEHLADATAPELAGGEFTNTFIWGHWENELVFFEPMITVEYLEGLQQGQNQGPVQEGRDTRRISMPERFPEAGRYPTEYSVQYHDNEDAYTVTLELFKPFEESDGVGE